MPEAGRLLVCATPIGNLGDVTMRVLDALRASDVVYAEDTRVTRKLLARYDIDTPVERCDENVMDRKTAHALDRIGAGGVVALVSDAGTPGISDPGARLVSAVLDAAFRVEVLPGPSAILTALVASGLPTHAFYFGGFLPRKAGEIRRALAKLVELDATLVFYESPHRAAASLAFLSEAFPGRRAVFARELTKRHEECVRGTVEEVAEAIAARETVKGEVVLLVGPPEAGGSASYDEGELRARVEALVALGTARKEAVRVVAAETGAPRNRVYSASLGGGRGD